MKALAANLPFGVYLAALLCFGVSFVAKAEKWRKAGTAWLAAGWAAQTVLLALRWAEGGRAPMANQHESLLVLSWGVMLLFFWLRKRLALSGMGFWVAVCCLVILAAASLFDRSIQPLMPALQSNWLFFHVIVVMVGYAAFALAAVGGGVYVMCYRGLAERPRKDVKDTALAVRIEKALSLDEFMFRAATLGFLFLTGGIILGSVWANEAWGRYWSWDPKETWSLITWFVYAIAIHLRRTRGWIGTRFAWLTLMGLGFVVFTYFGVNFLLEGLHSYAK